MLRGIRYSIFIAVSLFFCSWGFHAHRTINRNAVYTLPSDLAPFFMSNIDALEARSVHADKRRYTDTTEACKHYIDLDLYGVSPFDSVPKHWFDAKNKFSEDTLKNRGILPWVINWEYRKLIWAMDSGTSDDVVRSAADLGHYVADACVPLHTTYNYNGQYTNQKGIHALWESRIPESFSHNYDYYVGKSVYLENPLEFTWKLIEESFVLVDSTLAIEQRVSGACTADDKYKSGSKNRKIVHEYTYEFISDYNLALDGMVEQRLQRAIIAIGSYWYSAWIDAGQPDLLKLYATQEVDNLNKKRDFSPKRIHE